ncbi:MAG TPA: thioredoxin domain-containing protein [Bdellovibrionota bacterium]|nr:thioredoxin domain-containing protein [Bdellovibrionota bacterium]
MPTMKAGDGPSRLKAPVGARDHAIGPADASVTLVEYGDYECPYCGEAYGIVRAVIGAMGPRLRYVFRNFPLTEIHEDAMAAALAAEAAGAQGRFWEMHSKIFENQESLDPADFIAHAEQLGLDVPRFIESVEEGKLGTRIRNDIRSGAKSGVDSTPTFFINGVLYEGPWDHDALLSVLEEEAGRSLGEVA